MLLALITSLRGSVCLYQGEELGLPEAEIAFEQLQDPYGIRFWPEFKGRDGCRTPMPWRDAPHGAFTHGTPWLPVPEAHQRRSVETQERDASSLLHYYRAFIAWRNNQPTLRSGDIRFVDVAEPLLAFERSEGTDKILCIFNFSATAQTMELPFDARALTDVPSMTDQTMDGRRLTLKPYGYFYAWVS